MVGALERPKSAMMTEWIFNKEVRSLEVAMGYSDCNGGGGPGVSARYIIPDLESRGHEDCPEDNRASRDGAWGSPENRSPPSSFPVVK